MKKDNKTLAFALSSITQLGISIIVSFLLWIMIAMWVKKTFNLGNFVMVIGIFCGAGSAGTSFYNFCRKISNLTKEEDEDEA